MRTFMITSKISVFCIVLWILQKFSASIDETSSQEFSGQRKPMFAASFLIIYWKHFDNRYDDIHRMRCAFGVEIQLTKLESIAYNLIHTRKPSAASVCAQSNTRLSRRSSLSGAPALVFLNFHFVFSWSGLLPLGFWGSIWWWMIYLINTDTDLGTR